MEQLVQLLESIKLPIEIPLLLHGPIVHFAIAIPVIALLLEISNLALKRRCVGVISGLLLTLAGIVYLAAYLTGKTDGSEAYALLSQEGQEELKEHKMLGIYLVYGIWGVVVLKLIFMAIRKFWAKALFTLILAGFVAASFVQGKDGGELVYEFGANVKAVSALDDKIMELEDEIDTLKEKCKEQPATATKSEAAPATTQPQKEESDSATQPTSETAESHAATNEHASETNESTATPAPSSASSLEEKAKAALEEIKGDTEQEAAAQTPAETETTHTETNETTTHESAPEEPAH